MHWILLLTFLCLTYSNGVIGNKKIDEDDFIDMDWILQNEIHLKRVARAPDYGAGLGGPLAASSWTPPGTGGSAKPAAQNSPSPPPPPKPQKSPSPPPPPPPPPPPMPMPPTKKPTSPTNKPKSQEKQKETAPTSKPSGPTAPTKAPSKEIKPADGGGGGGGGSPNGKSGEDIANDIYNHPNECHDPKNGGIWAPLPSGQPCGKEGNCNYPQQWCAAKMSSTTSANPDLTCQDLPPECQKAISGETTTAAVTAVETTSPTTTPSTTKMTTPSTKATQATTKASTPAAADTKPTSGCQDQHPYCCFWADNSGRPSECDQNAKWMKTVCQKSCGTCGCSGDPTSCPTKVNTQGCPFTSGGQGQGQGQGMRTIFIGGNGQQTQGMRNPMATSGASPSAGPVNPTAGANPTSGTNPTNPASPPAGLTRILFG